MRNEPGILPRVIWALMGVVEQSQIERAAAPNGHVGEALAAAAIRIGLE